MKPCCCGHQGAPWCLGLSWGAQGCFRHCPQALVCLVEETGPERGWVSLGCACVPPSPRHISDRSGAAGSRFSDCGTQLPRVRLRPAVDEAWGRAVGFSQRGVATPGPLPRIPSRPPLPSSPWGPPSAAPALEGGSPAPALPQAPVYPQGFPLGQVGGQEGAWEQSPRIPGEKPLLACGPQQALPVLCGGPRRACGTDSPPASPGG